MLYRRNVQICRRLYEVYSGLSYIIDQKQINKVAKSKKLGGKNKAEAIKAKAEEKINDKLSKRNKAEDGIRKAQEALDKFGEELYKTFFAWENELTKILEMDKVHNRKWLVQGSSAISGQGLKEGLDWLANALIKKK